MNDVDLEATRALLRVRVATDGLTRVAREMEMSTGGLRQFLGGTRPVPATRRKALAWRRRYVDGDARTDQEELVDRLLAAKPEGLRPEMRRRILALLGNGDGPQDALAAAPGPRGCVILQPVFHLDLRTCAHPEEGAHAGS